jgi:catechol-2,3-dioxygenase
MDRSADIVEKFGYLSVGVRDLDEAVEFYSRIARLEVTERNDRTVYMTGGPEHHWLRLEEGGQPGVRRIAYELVDDHALDVVRDRLNARGIACDEGSDSGGEHVQHWLRFTSPDGTHMELYRGMRERGVAPDSPIGFERLLHAGWKTADFAGTTEFYQDVLGFRASDWIGDIAGFFRVANRFHHSAAILSADRAAFDHVCIQVDSLDDVMRLRSNAQRFGVKFRSDLLRHAPSGSIGIYLHDEARGYAVEFCIGHPQVDNGEHRPRMLEMAPETRDVWSAPLPEPRAMVVRDNAGLTL